MIYGPEKKKTGWSVKVLALPPEIGNRAIRRHIVEKVVTASFEKFVTSLNVPPRTLRLAISNAGKEESRIAIQSNYFTPRNWKQSKHH
jgi:hypothetical protein